MKININNYDLVITSKNGEIHVYENGHELNGGQSILFKANLGELPYMELKQYITDKNGNFHFTGGFEKEKEKENV